VALCAGFVAMSAAKRALRKAIASFCAGRGPAPRILRHCDACGEEQWRPLDRRVRRVELNAHLADGRRADLALTDGSGRIRMLVQLADGSRLANRSETIDGTPVLVLSGAAVVADPLRWQPVRERGLQRWRCRCALARSLPVDDAFSLRVIGCPLNLRRENAKGGPAYASVIHDCARCAFFVGIGYADAQRRRVSLYCAFGTPPLHRIGPAPAPRLPAPQPIAANDAS
jgi:hypothetical protein